SAGRTAPGGRLAIWLRSPLLAAEVCIEAVEDRASLCQPLFVVAMDHRDARDQRFDACDLGALEFVVLQIDVVDDLCDRPEGGILEAEAPEQHLERAPTPIVRELRLEHVEAQLAPLRAVATRGDEFEPRFVIHEATDEPRARDPVD